MATHPPAVRRPGIAWRTAPLRPAHWPWWVQVLVVYLGARLVSAVVLLLVARTQAANLWTPQAPSYAQYTGLMWDASWYREIAEGGYPDVLPTGSDGQVLQSAWAFFPLFPALARALMAVTGASWQVVAPTLALVAGTGAALVVHQVVAAAVDRAPQEWPSSLARRLPLATVAVLATFAAAPVLQVAYTESLALLLLTTALWCLLRRHYLAAVPVVLGLGLTRAVALPVAVAVGAHAVARLRAALRGDEDFPARDRLAVTGLGVATVVSGLLWPAAAGALTGRPDAYTQVQGAWRGRGEVVPLVPWFDVARWLVGGWWWLLLAAVLGLAVLAVLAPPLRRLGPELWGWTVGYLGYLLVAIEPGTSLLRFLLLAFPLAALAAALALRSRRWRFALTALVLIGVAGQVGWVGLLWRLVPPSGWPP